MVRPLGLPFDPIERAGQTWEQRFGPASAMRAATSVFRVQQILLARFDEVLKPHGLTFARYEVLVLLTFSRTGELPLKVIGSRLMVHPTSVTNAIDRLVAAGYVDRRPNPNDGRGVLAAITDDGRRVVERGHRGADRPRLRPRRPARRPSRADALRRPQAGAAGRGGRGRRRRSTPDSWTSYYLGMTQDARQRWQQRYDAALAGGQGARRRLHDAVRRRGRPGLRAGRRVRRPGLRADRLSGRVPVHPRPARHRLPRPGVDHPAVRRLRQRPADQRALQDDPGRGRRRAVRRLRHAHPHGPRLRRPARARRGRPLRRRHRLRRRHGRALRRHPARRRRRRR